MAEFLSEQQSECKVARKTAVAIFFQYVAPKVVPFKIYLHFIIMKQFLFILFRVKIA